MLGEHVYSLGKKWFGIFGTVQGSGQSKVGQMHLQMKETSQGPSAKSKEPKLYNIVPNDGVLGLLDQVSPIYACKV